MPTIDIILHQFYSNGPEQDREKIGKLASDTAAAFLRDDADCAFAIIGTTGLRLDPIGPA